MDGRDDTLAKLLVICKIYKANYAKIHSLDSKSAVIASLTEEKNRQNTEVDSIKRFCFKCGFPQTGIFRSIPNKFHIPSNLKPLVKKKLLRSALYHSSRPSCPEWMSQISLESSRGRHLDICLDQSPLNECIRWEIFLIPTVANLISELANTKAFKAIDLTRGFFHNSLDRASSDLTTFMTPFGLSCAPEMVIEDGGTDF